MSGNSLAATGGPTDKASSPEYKAARRPGRQRLSHHTPRRPPENAGQTIVGVESQVAKVAVVETAPSIRNAWVAAYRRRLVALDFAVATFASLAAFAVRFGGASSFAGLYLVLASLLPFAWVSVVATHHGYDARIFGAGSDEYQLIVRAFAYLTAIVAIVSYATKADLARGFILAALPATILLDLLARYAARKQLHHGRASGVALTRVLVVGSPDRVADLATAMMRDVHAGYQVVGACLPTVRVDVDALDALEALGVRVVGSLDDIVAAVALLDVDTVAVTASPDLRPEKLRWISWQLEGTGTGLVVSPGLIEVAGTRLHVRPVSGFPLLHVEAPNFSGLERVLKGAFDRIAALVALVVLSPLLLVIALAVRCTSPGPALFRQVRVGRDGSLFTMFKFRSMGADAEQRRAELEQHNEATDGLLFKIRQDPRVTRVGAVLRRCSLDELPQLLNVIAGSMSLVGPRPPLPAEVAAYGDDVRRRLLVKPGLTGLWQISGRSNLSWEESVRLDLRYVENWSMWTDVFILWKTLSAVRRASGAY